MKLSSEQTSRKMLLDGGRQRLGEEDEGLGDK